MSSITLNQIIVKENRVDYFFSVTGNLKNFFHKDYHLFLEYNFDVLDVPDSILAIPFVSNILPLAWITNSLIRVDQLDKSFYECLDSLKEAYQTMFPHFEFKGEIRAGEIINNIYDPQRDAASLFSGGLDALTTFIRVKEKTPYLITEYGWHEKGINNSEVWEADKQNAINFAKINGLENILIQSNYGTFMVFENIDREYCKKLGDSWWHGLHHGLAIISAAIPMAFKLKVKCIYIASSNSPLFKVACASDPTVDNKIRFASGGVFHDAYELTRQDKVKVVVDYYSGTHEPVCIRVCFKNEENCCKCEKCLRTILGIIAEGKNPMEFGFNIPQNVPQFIKTALDDEVKFFTDNFIIMYWEIIQRRMKENYEKVLFKDLTEWFLGYDFKLERKKSLIKYRITKLIPILKRKFTNKFNRMFVSR